MRFWVSVKEYLCGDEESISVDTPPLPGAYCKEETAEERYAAVRDEDYIAAELDDSGKPVIVHKTRRKTAPPPTWFKQKGMNHRREGDFWVRDVVLRSWFIDIPSLERLLAIVSEPRSNGYVELSAETGDEPGLVVHR